MMASSDDQAGVIYRVPDSASGGAIALDQIRQNSDAVIEDHHLFKEVQANRAEAVRARTFEELLADSYEMAPQPLPEEDVENATNAAIQSLQRERGQAGGLVSPPAEARRIPEPPALMDDPEEGEGAEVTPGEVPRQPAITNLVDLYRYIRELEDRVDILQGAVTGMNVRIARDLPVEGHTAPLRASVVPSAKASQEEEAGQSTTPRRQATPGKPMNLSERRSRRGENPRASGSTASFEESVPASVEMEYEDGDDDSSPRVVGGRKFSLPRLPNLAGLLSVRRFALAGLAAALLALVCVGISLAKASSGVGDARREALLVERQVQGVGAYVRAEEQALVQSLRRVPVLEQELGRLRGVGAGTEDWADAQRRMPEVQRRLEQARLAAGGLQALQSVSGIQVEGGKAPQ